MNISKEAWHYKVVDEDFCFLTPWCPSRSLCIYFWQVVSRLLIGIMVGLLVTSPLATIMMFITGVNEGLLHLLSIIGAFVIVIIISVSLACLLVTIGNHFRDKRYKKYLESDGKSEEPKEPNILIEYIKAKKDKVCPVLTFESKE